MLIDNRRCFYSFKEDILAFLRTNREKLGITETVSLANGFVISPVLSHLTDSLVVGGPQIPMVMLIGEETGRVYFFALKAIIPEYK